MGPIFSSPNITSRAREAMTTKERSPWNVGLIGRQIHRGSQVTNDGIFPKMKWGSGETFSPKSGGTLTSEAGISERTLLYFVTKATDTTPLLELRVPIKQARIFFCALVGCLGNILDSLEEQRSNNFLVISQLDRNFKDPT